MIVIDANVLIYAYQADSPQHLAAKGWLENLFAGEEIIGLPWLTLWAFLRICTNPRAWPSPMPAATALQHIRHWLSQPGVVVLNPGPRHLEILEDLVTKDGAAGPLVTDAAVAAMAVENGAMLVSTDRDFSRFAKLRWINPIE